MSSRRGPRLPGRLSPRRQQEDEMPVLGLGPAAEGMSALIAAVPDEMLGRPTPCPAYRLGDLIDHVGGLALAFAAAGAKNRGPLPGSAPSGDAARLSEDWRTRIPRNLSAMAAAWRDPAAWTGMTQAGGGELPGKVAGPAGRALLGQVIGLAGRDPDWTPAQFRS